MPEGGRTRGLPETKGREQLAPRHQCAAQSSPRRAAVSWFGSGEGSLEAPLCPVTSEPRIWWQTWWWLRRARPLPPLPPPPQTPGLSCPRLLQKWISGVFFLVLRILSKQRGNTWIVQFPKTLQKARVGGSERRVSGTYRQKWFSASLRLLHPPPTTV